MLSQKKISPGTPVRLLSPCPRPDVSMNHFRSCKTKRCSETGEPGFESSHQGTPNSCLRFKDLGHVSRQGQVKGHNEAYSPFVFSGQLDGLQRGQTHPKSWIHLQKGYCISTKGIFTKVKVKVRSQNVTIKQMSQTCCATRVFWVILHADIDGESFDPMTSSTLFF